MKLNGFKQVLFKRRSYNAGLKFATTFLLLLGASIGFGQTVELSVNANAGTETGTTVITATATASANVSGEDRKSVV